MTKHDDQKNVPPEPEAKPRSKATMGFSCGAGPCKTFQIFENDPQPPKLPASPVEPEVPTFSLDTNCVVAVDEARAEATSIRALADAHASGAADVGLVAISASERQKLGGHLETFTEFQERMASLGLGHLPLLLPMMYWDVTYWDECLWADEQMMLLERELHEVLFPGIPHLWQDYCRKLGIEPELPTRDRKWRNAKCDVLAIWSHVFRKRQVFVTTDRNFHKASKKSKLIALGASRIETPSSAASILLGSKDAV